MRGVEFTGNDQTLFNAGIILGDTLAVELGTNSTLRNTGTISGNITSDSVDITYKVINFGTITGNIDKAFRITNAGTVIGDIVLNGDGNLYDGRQGNVSGLVDLRDGNDTALGGLGNDVFSGNFGDDLLHGGDGDDSLAGGFGNDIFNGGEGIDTVFLEDGITVVNLSLIGPQDTGDDSDTFISIENVTTGFNNDTITGNAVANALDASGGNDILNGGLGNDALSGGLGNDLLNGGEGSDTAIFTVGTGNKIVNLTLTNPQATGEGNDTLTAIENVTTGAGNDTLTGNTANNRFEGGTGNDSLFGNAGNDMLIGQIGNDVLIGGAGSDLLTGGTGADTFFFQTALAQAGIDKITDFVAADDTIRLKKSVFAALGLGQLTAPAFHLGTAAGDLTDRIIYDLLTGQLFYDADGLGGAAQIHFATFTSTFKPTLTVEDFLVV